MLTATSHVVNSVTPVKIVDGAAIDGEYEVIIQAQFNAMIGHSGITAGNGFVLKPIEDGIGDPRGLLKLRLQSEDLYAISLTGGDIIVGTLVYSV